MNRRKHKGPAGVTTALLISAAFLAWWSARPAFAEVTVGLNVAAIAIDPATQTVWAAVQTGGTSDAVDAISESEQIVTGTFAVPADVGGIAVDPQVGTWQGMVWASSGRSPGVAQILTGINESTQAVTTVDLTTASSGSQIAAIAADPVSHTIFAVMVSGNLVAIPEADPPKFTVIATAVGLSASAIAVDAGKVWVADQARDTVSAFTEQGNPVAGLTSIATGRSPVALAADAATGTLWVANEAGGTVTEISQSTGSVLASGIAAGANPTGIVAASSSKTIWVIGGRAAAPAIAQISEASTPGRLVAIGSALSAGLGSSQFLTDIAVDSVHGQVFVSGNARLSGFDAGFTQFVRPEPPSDLLNLAWFSTNNVSEDSFSVEGTAFPPMVFSMTGAPSWLHLNHLTGVLSGIPPATRGVVTFSHIIVTGTNNLGAKHVPFSLNVGSDPRITSAAMVTFVAGVPNRYQATASGAPAPMFLIEGTALPAGLTFSPSGLLSGTPAVGTEGRYIFGLVAANAVSPNGVGEVFTLDVVRGRAPAFASPARVTFRHGRPASFTIRASGLPAPRLRVKGTLPPGLRITMGKNGTALIHGIPTLPRRTYRLTVTAANGIGRPATQILAIVIS